jgi:5-methylcytosine-specific restriction enzyme subunit McrC
VTAEPLTIELTEFSTTRLPERYLTAKEAEFLWPRFNKELSIDPPSFKTGGQWELTPQGWVGQIPLPGNKIISIAPKVPLKNVFSMLAYAYDLESFRFLPGLWAAQSINELVERLAGELARRVKDRVMRGLYRTYVSRDEPLTFLRGAVRMAEIAQKPWRVAIPCSYEEHTPDIEDNQILAWTLERIASAGFCGEKTLSEVRGAYRSLLGSVESKPFRAKDCVGRLYNRLNEDYSGTHSICRFFLEHLGPTQVSGDRRAVPFLVDMSRLYERFVAAWLESHTPALSRIEVQESVSVGETDELKISIDIVLYDAILEKAMMVLDTKYKASGELSRPDLYQMVTYAHAKSCTDAVLIYPVDLERPLELRLNEITVRNVTFALEGDLDENGRIFLNGLGFRSGTVPAAPLAT